MENENPLEDAYMILDIMNQCEKSKKWLNTNLLWAWILTALSSGSVGILLSLNKEECPTVFFITFLICTISSLSLLLSIMLNIEKEKRDKSSAIYFLNEAKNSIESAIKLQNEK